MVGDLLLLLENHYQQTCARVDLELLTLRQDVKERQTIRIDLWVSEATGSTTMTWYRRASGKSGPFTEQEIVKRIADGNISSGAMIRKAPSTEWSPIAQSEFSAAFGESNPYKDPKIDPTLLTSKRSLLRYSLAVAASICLVTILAAGSVNSPEAAREFLGECIGRMVVIGVFWRIVSLLRWKRIESAAQLTPFTLAMAILATGTTVLFTGPSASDYLPAFRTGLIEGCVKEGGDERFCRTVSDCVFNELGQQRGDAALAKWLSKFQRDPTVQRQVERTLASCAQNMPLPVVAPE